MKKDIDLPSISIVKNRSGSVLGRGMILKSDHFEEAESARLSVHLQGASNFRMAAKDVFGVAQPTVAGIRTVYLR
jgi:hypothetical protein